MQGHLAKGSCLEYQRLENCAVGRDDPDQNVDLAVNVFGLSGRMFVQ